MPQFGKILVGEYELIPKNLKFIRNFVGLVFQNPDDQIFMPTVGEDIKFGPMNQGITGKNLDYRCSESLEAVGLDPVLYLSRNASHLSGGEKKRVAIGKCWPCSPKFSS